MSFYLSIALHTHSLSDGSKYLCLSSDFTQTLPIEMQADRIGNGGCDPKWVGEFETGSSKGGLRCRVSVEVAPVFNEAGTVVKSDRQALR